VPLKNVLNEYLTIKKFFLYKFLAVYIN